MVMILIISIVALFFSIIILFPVIRKVNANREEVLCLFLDIPKRTVKTLSNKCEKYVASLQEEGDNASIESDAISINDNIEIVDEEEQQVGTGQSFSEKRRK